MSDTTPTDGTNQVGAENKGDPLRFLRLLYPDDAPGWLTIWTPDKHTAWFRPCDLSSAAEYAMERSADTDVYFGVGLRRSKLASGRGGVPDVIGIPALWMDFDIAHAVHKRPDLPPSLHDVLGLIASIPQEPTMLVHSGYGVHAYWAFKEVWCFDGDVERQKAAHLLRRLHETFKATAKRAQWGIDSTFSLDHVLRLPGTLNHKVETDLRIPYVMEPLS